MIREVHGMTVIQFAGEIDIAAGIEIRPRLDAATSAAEQTVVVDLTPVEFFDCSGLRLLCRADERVRERGGRLLLVCPHPLIRRLLRACGLLGWFSPLRTLEEALVLGSIEATG
nr:STAS domain-containing protein [Streptomyces sp. CRN 30]